MSAEPAPPPQSSSSSSSDHASLTTIPSLLGALTAALSHIEQASHTCDAELQVWRRRTARLDRARLAYTDEAAERTRLRADADTLLRALEEETSEAAAELAFEQARDKAARKVDAATRLATRDVGRVTAAAAAKPPPQAQAQGPAAPGYCTAEVASLVEARLLPSERRAVLLELSKRVEANRVETEAVRAAGVIQPMQELLDRLGVRRVRGGAAGDGDGDGGGGLWWRALERKLREAADGAVAAGGGGGDSNSGGAAEEVEARYLKGAVDAAMELLGLVEEAKGLGGEGEGGEGDEGGRRPVYAYGDWKVLFPLWYLADRLLATTAVAADGTGEEGEERSALRVEMACAARVCEALREARVGGSDSEGGGVGEGDADAADAAADSEFVDDYLADFFSDVGGGGGGGGAGEGAAAPSVGGNGVAGGAGCRGEEEGDGTCPAQRSLRHVEESVLAPLFLQYAGEGGCDEASWGAGGGGDGDGDGGVSDEHYCKLALLRLFSALSLHHGVFLPPVAKTVRPSHPPLPAAPPC